MLLPAGGARLTLLPGGYRHPSVPPFPRILCDEEGSMQKELSIIGCFGLLLAVYATPALSASAYDGTYQLVSSTKVSATYTTRGGQTGSCPDRNPGPLTIVQGRVQYTSATGRHFEGTVSPQGRLLLNRIEEVLPNSSNTFEMNVSGNVDRTGTIRAIQRSYSCSYNFVWQKQ
jgi:hypothetical protein